MPLPVERIMLALERAIPGIPETYLRVQVCQGEQYLCVQVCQGMAFQSFRDLQAHGHSILGIRRRPRGIQF